jgi:hypothetical protein
MTTNFPGTSLDTLTNPTATDSVATVDHAAQHANANDAIEALEAKVGVNGSAVTTSHDYKLSTVTSTDKCVGVDANQVLTSKTLTSPTINTPSITGGNFTSGTMVTGIINGTTAISLGQDATGDVYYRNASGNLQRLPVGSTNEVLTVTAGIPAWETAQTGSLASTSGVSNGPASSTTQVITHGLGRTPVIIRLHGIGRQASGQGSVHSHGAYTGSGNSCVWMPGTGEDVLALKSGTAAIWFDAVTAGGNDAVGYVTNLTSSTFGIVWTADGDVSAASVFHWEAQ